MMINLDKFFILELQKRGYDFDYKKLSQIYRDSRKRPDCQARKKRKIQDEILIDKMMDKFNND